MLFSISDLELMRGIRGGGGLIVLGNGEEHDCSSWQPLLPWRSVVRQLEMCRPCLNSVCIINCNHLLFSWWC